MIEIKTTKEIEEMNTLRDKYAFIEGKPILNASQMLDDIDVVVYEADNTVEDLVEEHKEKSILYGTNPAFISELEYKLCSFGGDVLIYDLDEYAELILEEGQLWYGNDIFFEEMEMGKCHSNAVLVNSENPELPIVVGYALDENGFWFSHTWLLAREDGDKGYCVYETTSPSALYFGVVLTESQLKRFKENYK